MPAPPRSRSGYNEFTLSTPAKHQKKPRAARWLIVGLFVLLTILQTRLWISKDGFSEVSRLDAQVELQRTENEELDERNARLRAEVEDLRGGFAAVEERARSSLGLIAPEESFFLFSGGPDGEEVEGE